MQLVPHGGAVRRQTARFAPRLPAPAGPGRAPESDPARYAPPILRHAGARLMGKHRKARRQQIGPRPGAGVPRRAWRGESMQQPIQLHTGACRVGKK